MPVCLSRGGWCRALNTFPEDIGTKMMLKGTSLRYMLVLAILSGFSHKQGAGAAAVHAVGPEAVAREVTIYRDVYGVPHVFGRTDAATVFGFAYAQAEDNFWRIEDSYISAIGRDSEV